MNYELFVKLYGEALEYSDIDLYIAERGWQEWMDKVNNPSNVLKLTYRLANQSCKDMRESAGYSRAALSRAYNIPIRTLEDWEKGVRTPPVYLITLIAYTFLEVE